MKAELFFDDLIFVFIPDSVNYQTVEKSRKSFGQKPEQLISDNFDREFAKTSLL